MALVPVAAPVVPRVVHGKQLALVAVLALAAVVVKTAPAPVAALAMALVPVAAPVVPRVVQNPLLPRVDHLLARALAPAVALLLAVAVLLVALVEQQQLTQLSR